MDIDPPGPPENVNTSPGRRLLDVNTIVRRIIREYQPHIVGLGTYARMARTCKSLFHPSIKPLWSWGGSLRYLVKTLPSDCWEVDSPPEERFQVSIKLLRKLKPVDLQRLNIYAQYITLFRSTALKTEVLSAIISAHSEAFGTPHFLPNLSHLHWETDVDSDFPFVMMFLNSQLRSLTVSLAQSSASRFAFLAHISVLCPLLKHLSLNGGEDSGIIAVGSSLLVGWEYLVSLKIKCVSTEVMMYLSQMQRLSDLTLEHVDNIDWGTVKRYHLSLDKAAFAALDQFALLQAQFSPCIDMLKQVHLPVLKHLILGFNQPLDRRMWTLLLNTLQIQCPKDLDAIILRDIAPPEQPVPQNQGDEQITIDDIRLLFPFKNVTQLSLRTSCDFDLDDSGIQEIAKAFPKLTDLLLHTHQPRANPADSPSHPLLRKCTLDSLYHLSVHCPDISCIDLSFDARTIPPILAGNIAHPSKLSALVVGYSPLDDTKAVAHYLKKVFPKLCYIVVKEFNNSENDTPLGRKWKEVQQRVRGVYKGEEIQPTIEEGGKMDDDKKSI
ncbi:hypothetical protein BDN72DRAFT_842428 [Pluteus cervinus]|uniref:Uncharacterized protein n=1 Tax=Pluteus cervinus TaxID=181527 RepID=A0ACD3ARK1_9AGAR|nr:hypothetical protein BDN72DRAFT_842428 [Pluteus cervinus]